MKNGRHSEQSEESLVSSADLSPADSRTMKNPSTIEIDDDHFHDHCGVFGIFGNEEAAKLAYLGL
jgi:hypothetical protein